MAVTGFVAYRLRRRGGDEPFLTRVIFALFPGTDPKGPRWLGVTALSFILVTVGMVLALVALLLVKVVNR